MSKYYWLLILGLAIAVPALTQESADEPPATEEQAGETAETDTAAEDADAASDELDDLDEFDDADLDEQTYEEDEDVFVPTEEIPSDEPIPFPTNI